MMARMIGGANPTTMRSTEISTELRITRRMSGSEKISRKFCSPTQGLLTMPSPSLRSLKAMIQASEIGQ